MAKIKITENTESPGKDAEQLELSYIADGNAKWQNPSGKQFCIF